MESFLFSVNAPLPIFLTMLCGLLFRRLGLMDQRFTAYLNAFVFKVALPALLFRDLATQDFADAWDGRYVLFCLVATTLSIAAIVLLGRALVPERPRRGEFIQVSYRSSAAILGLAFIQNIYGSASTSMGALMILGSVPLYNVAAVAVLTLTAEGTDEGGAEGTGADQTADLVRKSLVGIAKNPIIIGVVAGLAWSVLRLPMPDIAASTLKNVAVLATPLGLMAMGASFSIEDARGDLRLAGVATAIKLVVLVAIFLPLAILMGFRYQQLVALLVLLGSASTVSCYIMAKNMGHDGTLTSTAVMMTTFGCAVTLTLWLWLVSSLGLVG